MNFSQINNWISLTAIAVDVQQELDAFKSFKLLTGLKLSCLNRLKVITAIAFRILIQFSLTLSSCSLYMKGELTFKRFAKVIGFGSIENIATIIFGFIALPLTEIMLQGWPLNRLWELERLANPYLMAGLKNKDARQCEKGIWQLAKETRNDLLNTNLITKEELQQCDTSQIRYLIRATTLQMLKQWREKPSINQNRFKNEIMFEKRREPGEVFKFYDSMPTLKPNRIDELGTLLKQAIKTFNQLSDVQKENLKKIFLEDENLDDIAGGLSEKDQKDLLSVFHAAGIIENVLTKRLLNSQLDFELSEKAQSLFMCE